MRLAILSDTHDNLWALKDAMPRLAQADVVLHCGDLCSPFMLRHLAEGLPNTPLHVVWGNNEGDVLLMTRIAAQHPHLHLHGAFAELTLDGARVALNHYPEIAHGLALSGKYDLVCCGHSHKRHAERVGQCLWLNPGEIMGLLGPRTLALFDTATREVTWVTLP
jgi:hypothetical protein